MARLTARGLRTAEQVADAFLTLLVDADAPRDVRASLVAYLNDPAPFEAIDAATRDTKVRGLVHLIMSTPVYQSA
jgi:hypothetical protein